MLMAAIGLEARREEFSKGREQRAEARLEWGLRFTGGPDSAGAVRAAPACSQGTEGFEKVQTAEAAG